VTKTESNWIAFLSRASTRTFPVFDPELTIDDSVLSKDFGGHPMIMVCHRMTMACSSMTEAYNTMTMVGYPMTLV
jgi:hypothetical protein